MKTIKATGEKVCSTRQELADKYFDYGTGHGGLGVYAVGNLGMVTLLSDLQEEVAMSNISSKEHYRQILNDLKGILIQDNKTEVEK